MNLLTLLNLPHLYAQIATGGGYSLMSSVVDGGGYPQMSGSSYTANASIGQGFFPARDAEKPLATSGFRVYEGYFSRPLLYDHTRANTIIFPSSLGQVTLPSNSMPIDYEPMLEQTPLFVSPSLLNEATQKLRSINGPYVQSPISLLEISMLTEDGALFSQSLSKPALMTLVYNDTNGDGIVDGSNPPVRINELSPWILDETSALWVRLAGTNPGSLSTAVEFPVSHFSVYTLFGTASTQVNFVYAFPVPWRPNFDDPARYGTLAGGITFTNLPSEGSIKIFDVAGELVRTINIPVGLFPPKYKWDVKTESGQDVVSGVYIWVVESGSNRKFGKLMVIR
ncbi:MAG: hypothetical protein HY401_08785 [Elusimicrobia bacterium]|nr:hypothetical protein [Elusimicrobiota bacterium]